MKYDPRGLCFCIVLFCLGDVVYSTWGVEPRQVNKLVSDTATVTDVACTICLSKDNTMLPLCLDQDGRYMPDVREVVLWLQLAKTEPTKARLLSWRGVVKPTSNIRREDRFVKEIRFVDADEYQKLVDSATE